MADHRHGRRGVNAEAAYLPGYAAWRAAGQYPAFMRREARHEAAHAIARHGAERISRGMTAAVILGVASASGEVDPEIVAATALAYGALGETAFSRSEESEADAIGLIIAADAGYDPRSAVGFWKKMAALGNGGVPEFLSTHPSGETRAARLAQLMPRAMQVYEQSRSRTP
ncbi:MAG: M48 family metallopeptidase [Phycisphaerales bacterium]